MLPAFLVPETTICHNGASEPLKINVNSPLLVTLGVLQVIEQESLLLSVEASPDSAEWVAAPLATFPEKFYTGVSAVYIDLREHAVCFLRAAWKVNRWGRGDKTPFFRVYVFLEALTAEPPSGGSK